MERLQQGHTELWSPLITLRTGRDKFLGSVLALHCVERTERPGFLEEGTWFHQSSKFLSKNLLKAERVFLRNITFLVYFYLLSQSSTYGNSWRQDSEPDNLTH